MTLIFKIMFLLDLTLLASIRYINIVPFPTIIESFTKFEKVLTSQYLKMSLFITFFLLLQKIFICIIIRIANKSNDKEIREISNEKKIMNIEHNYLPSYIGVSILAFSLSEQLSYCLLLILFYLVLMNTRVIYFSPWLKLFKNYKLYTLNNNGYDELLLIKGNDKEDHFKIYNLVNISTDVYIGV